MFLFCFFLFLFVFCFPFGFYFSSLQTRGTHWFTHLYSNRSEMKETQGNHSFPWVWVPLFSPIYNSRETILKKSNPLAMALARLWGSIVIRAVPFFWYSPRWLIEKNHSTITSHAPYETWHTYEAEQDIAIINVSLVFLDSLNFFQSKGNFSLTVHSLPLKCTVLRWRVNFLRFFSVVWYLKCWKLTRMYVNSTFMSFLQIILKFYHRL